MALTVYWVASGSVFASEITVDPNQGFAGIQAALDDAQPGDEVILPPGHYTREPVGALQVRKPVTLRSQDPNDPNIVSRTILLCPTNGVNSIYALDIEGVSDYVDEDGQDIPFVLAGVTLTGGIRESAIFIYDSDCVIQSCVIRDNQAGGIESLNSKVELDHCDFENNSNKREGGAISLEGSRLQANHCQWLGNQSEEEGGALFMGDYSSVTLHNSVFVGNRATESGGAVCYKADHLELINCTLVGNVAGEEGGALMLEGELSLTNTIVVYNQDYEGVGRSIDCYSGGRTQSSDPLESVTALHCCLQLDPGETEGPFADPNQAIFTDPLFVRLPDGGSDGWGDNPDTVDIDEGANDDYGDLNQQPNSPCVNAGFLIWIAPDEVDLNGSPRIMGSVIDMGALEFWQPTVITTRPQGGEQWAAGSRQTITWISTAVDGVVNVLLSPDQGLSWQPLAEEIGNGGTYTWDIPMDGSMNQALIQVVPVMTHPYQYTAASGLFNVAAMTPGQATTSSWPTLAGQAARTGLASTQGPLSPIEVVDINVPGKTFTSVVLGYDNRIHVASNGGILYSFNQQGEEVWSVDVNSPLMSSPTVGPDGSVYVGDRDGRLHAFAYDGTLNWTWQTEGFVYASAAISDQNEIVVASEDGCLYALSPNGTLLWSFTMDSESFMTDAIMASPSLGSDGTVYISGYFDATVYALNPVDGVVHWARACDSDPCCYGGHCLVAPVVADNGMIYQGMVSDPCLYALEPTQGDIEWILDLSAPITVIADEGSSRTRITTDVVEGINGTVEPGDSMWTEPALGPDGTIYVSLDDPYLRAVSPEGVIQWITQLGTGQGFSLTVDADGMIYAAGDDGILYVINSEGQTVGELPIGNRLIYPVIGSEGVLILTDIDHGVRVYHDLF